MPWPSKTTLILRLVFHLQRWREFLDKWRDQAVQVGDLIVEHQDASCERLGRGPYCRDWVSVSESCPVATRHRSEAVASESGCGRDS